MFGCHHCKNWKHLVKTIIMGVQGLAYKEIFGENYFQCREALLALVFILFLAKIVQVLITSSSRARKSVVQLLPNGVHGGTKHEKESYEAYHSLPGPRPLPLVGNIFTLIKANDVIKTCQNLAKEYGPCYKIKLLGDDFVVLNTPQMVQCLLSSNDNGHFRKGGVEEKLWPEGVHTLVHLTGNEWRTRRKMLNRSFTYKSLQRYNSSFNRHSEKLIVELGKLFEDGQKHTIDEIVRNCVLRQTAETLLGVELSESESAIFCESVEMALDTQFMRVYRPWLYPKFIWNLHPLSRKLNKYLEEICRITTQVMKTYSKNTDKTTVDTTGPVSGNLVEVLLHHGVTEKDIFHEVNIMLAIAYDTTSVSIIFALYLLASNPTHQKLCRDEIDEVFSDPEKYKNGALAFHALADLKYLERCILEAQRLYPLATAMRKMESPLKLSEELVIPPGVVVFYMSHVLHYNSEYFPNPQVFDPDRFLPEATKARHPYAYLPFSSGPRSCIGMKLAIIELKMILGKILHHFEISTTDTDVKLSYNGIPRPSKPINFVFRKRKP